MSDQLVDTIATMLTGSRPPGEPAEMTEMFRQWKRADIQEVLEALRILGYTLTRPVTAGEEAANVW